MNKAPALFQDRIDEIPDKQTQTKERHKIVYGSLEYLRIHNTERDYHHGHADSEPERSEKRPPITLQNIVPAQLSP